MRMTKEAQSTNDECCSHRPVAGIAETRTAHSAVACIFKWCRFLCKTGGGARSTPWLLLVLDRERPVVRSALALGCVMNSNSYWSDQAGPPQGQVRPGQLASNKQEFFNT